MSENKISILYLCDGKKCGEKHDCGPCKYTCDINHAVNFKKPEVFSFDSMQQEQIFMEKERPTKNEVDAYLRKMDQSAVDNYIIRKKIPDFFGPKVDGWGRVIE